MSVVSTYIDIIRRANRIILQTDVAVFSGTPGPGGGKLPGEQDGGRECGYCGEQE